jgi:outer membrane protein assembly factor BamA
MSLSTTFATAPESFRVKYQSTFTQVLRKAWLHLDAEFTQLRFTKYYGYGNETFYSDDLEDNDYYKLSQEMIFIQPHISFHLNNKVEATLGVSINFSHSELAHEQLLVNCPFDDYGVENFFSGNVFNEVKIDFRDNSTIPKEGFVIKTKLNYFPELFDVNENFLRAEFDLRNYFTLRSSTIAFRFGTAKVFGDYPFLEGVYLGGSDNLRGFARERFSGDAMLFGKAELRNYLADVKFILKGKLGFNTFIETGRVYAQNENSSRWHPS